MRKQTILYIALAILITAKSAYCADGVSTPSVVTNNNAVVTGKAANLFFPRVNNQPNKVEGAFHPQTNNEVKLTAKNVTTQSSQTSPEPTSQETVQPQANQALQQPAKRITLIDLIFRGIKALVGVILLILVLAGAIIGIKKLKQNKNEQLTRGKDKNEPMSTLPDEPTNINEAVSLFIKRNI